MTGDELVESIGARATDDLVVLLDKRGKAIAHYAGRAGRRSDDDELRVRSLEILRLRIVERRSYSEIAQAVGLSRPRIPEILHIYYGIDRKPRRSTSVMISAEALAVVRDALRMQLLSAMQDLCACITTGTGLEWEIFDLARGLLGGVEAADDDVEVTHLGRQRGLALAEALRRQLDTERHLAGEAYDEVERARHSADAAMIDVCCQ
jgi:hypothetical protein